MSESEILSAASPVGSRFFPVYRAAERHGRWEFPGYLDGALKWTRRLAAMYQNPRSYPASISPEAGLLLHAVTGLAAPGRALEIGCWMGISSIWMGAALGAGVPLHSIDLFGLPERQGLRGEAKRFLRAASARRSACAAGLGSVVTVRTGDSAAIVRRLAGAGLIGRPGERGNQLDFVYIDGDHSFEGALRDFLAVEPYLAEDALVLLHDVFPRQCGWEGPRQLISEREKHLAHRYEICDLYTAPLNYGITLLQKGLWAGKPAPSEALWLFLLFALVRNVHPRVVAHLGAADASELGAIRSAMRLAGADPSRADGEGRDILLCVSEGEGDEPRPPERLGPVVMGSAHSRGATVPIERSPTPAAVLQRLGDSGLTADMMIIGEVDAGELEALSGAVHHLSVGGYIVIRRLTTPLAELRVALESVLPRPARGVVRINGCRFGPVAMLQRVN